MSLIFTDRKSSYPNRYRITPETGTAYYAVLERADDPIDPGTPLNADTFNKVFEDVNESMGMAAKNAVHYNLLDNSDFTNPINQRGQTSYAIANYFIDRWVANSRYLEVSLTDSGIMFKNTYTGTLSVEQRFTKGLIETGKTYTGVTYLANGTVIVQPIIADDKIMKAYGTYESGVQWFVSNEKDGYDRVGFFVAASDTLSVVRVAMYEGEYTADTLPEYQPKGYGVELAECRRYFQRYEKVDLYATASYYCNADGVLFLPQQMRVVPTVSVSRDGNVGRVQVFVSGGEPIYIEYSAPRTSKDYIVMRHKTNFTGASVEFYMDYIELSADL